MQISRFMAFSMTHLITYVFLVLMPYVASITFNFTKIVLVPQNQNRDIIIEGGAKISDRGIQLTPNRTDSNWNTKAGRATYIRSLHLWSNRTGQVASFSTNFTFVINSNRNKSYGDGLTFFLAKNNSVIIAGGAMGLPADAITTDAISQFVAVEFDTFSNRWDPVDFSSGDHVGININSLASVRSQRWLSNVTGGGVCHAWITYDSVSKNLSVSFTGFQNNAVIRQDGLVYTVDLKNELPEWVIFGFSAATGHTFQRNIVKSWTFDSSDLQADEINELPPNTDPVYDFLKRKNKKVRLITGISSAISIIIVFVLAFIWWWRRWKTREEEEDISFDVKMNNDFEMGLGPKRFSYHELTQSTSNFAENQKLGEGGFGGVYRGFLKDSNTFVAVKRVSKSSKQGIKEYASEVKIISQLRHRNLVQLTGWCHKKGNLLLVYEYMENGSLDSHLFKNKSLLTWATRYKIAHGLASALLYLHEDWKQCVLHRDIKSSNVMLDSNFNAKLGDFGLAKLVDHEKGSQTTKLAGTIGYMAPECIVTGKASKESDVFSFGIVALEIACGRKVVDYKAQENQLWLLVWVWELYDTGTLLEAADPRLGSDYEEEDLKRLMIVGLWCAHPYSEHRPTMRQAIQVLKSEASLPVLPSKMPVASYLTPSIIQNQSCIASNRDSSNQSLVVGR